MLTFFRLSVLAVLASPATADVPRVVADIAPVHALVAQVMDGVGEPTLILNAGTSPHGYALRPSQARALQNADLVVWIGPELTPWLEKPVTSLATGAVKLGLLAAEQTLTLPFREGDEEEEEADGHDHDHDHDHDGVDPHAWLDPDNAQIWLMLIAEQLGDLDPENAGLYRNNAARGQAELQALSADLRALLTPVKSRAFVTFHDAFQYFEARFGLHNVGFVTLSDGANASPARVSALRDTLAAQDVFCAFGEPGTDTGILQGIEAGNGLTIAVLDPMGRDLTVGAGLYGDLLRAMAQSFVDCAGGAGDG